MAERQQDPGGYQIADKVRIRSGSHKGSRGVIRGEEIGLVEVELETGETTSVTALEVTNYSLAARRAWQSIPKNAGRPRSDYTKKMVSFRLDNDVTEMLDEALEKQLIETKSDVINTIVRDYLVSLLSKEGKEK